jgi:hypothetical protein
MYKKHREKILYDLEKSRLPDTQEDARIYKEAMIVYQQLKAQIGNLRQTYDNLPSSLYLKLCTSQSDIIEARNKRRIEAAPILLELNKLYEVSRTPKYIVEHWGRSPTQVEPEKKEKRTFIMKCPHEDCQGFLSTHYKCGLCDIHVCKDCHLIKTDSHVCDPDNVESVKQIKKETRPCPKCAAAISKIDGCDQMWCTQCRTAFSWRTGTIETKTIHNPHYFEFMRKRTDIPLPHGNVCAEVLDPVVHHVVHQDGRYVRRIYVRDNGENDLPLIYNYLAKKLSLKPTISNQLVDIYRNLIHTRHVTIRTYRDEVNAFNDDEWKRELRVQRLVGKITDIEWQERLQRKEKSYFKATAWLNLLEMYINTGLELIGSINRESTEENIIQILKQYENLRIYVDTQRLKIARIYQCTYPNHLEFSLKN